MKRYLPYLLIFLLILFLVLLSISMNSGGRRAMNERITYRVKDKIPYGYYIAYGLLKAVFPNSRVAYDGEEPGDWKSVDAEDTNQALILSAPYLNAYGYELASLLAFTMKGNHVLVITSTLNREAEDFFGLRHSGSIEAYKTGVDSMSVRLLSPPFPGDSAYSYRGWINNTLFTNYDPAFGTALGMGSGQVNFLRYQAGKGSISFHLHPLAFSNYFLLQGNNTEYYRRVLSVIPPDVKTVVWNDYYLDKPYQEYSSAPKEPGWLSVLFRYREFKYALLTILAAILAFLLLGMRRQQRLLPVHRPPRNESLDFVRTIGRLYFDKKDHRNLAGKLALYFLEHVRMKYKLPTHTLDEKFMESLHFKSGYPTGDIREIVDTIRELDSAAGFSERDLSDFFRKLELFYQNT